jgi:tRNA-modifying protein YgfZ
MTLIDDYRTIREGAAIGTAAERRQIAVSGADRATYLQGLLTNDIPALTEGAGCYAAWLSPQGRMLTDMHVLESGGMILLDVPASTVDATVARLEQFIFTEDVQVASLAGALVGVWVHGPHAASSLERVLGAEGLSEWPSYRHARFAFSGAPVSVARIDQLGVPGFCVYVQPDHERALNSALVTSGARAVSAESITAARIEAGYPVYGADMNDDILPLEAGIESRAISFSKGCYVGQEVVIRVLHRGQGRVAKRLVRLQMKDPTAAGAKLSAAGKEIGFVTSAAVSPVNGPIALGYVHRDYVAPGTVLDGATVFSS